MSNFYLSLNKTHLLFVPTSSILLGPTDIVSETRIHQDPSASTTTVSPSGLVVQISLRTKTRSDPGTKGRIYQDSIDVLAAYFLAQKDITDAIQLIVVTHLCSASPLTSLLPATVIIDAPGLGYTLTGYRKEWKYGHDKLFTWGSEQLAPAHDKWIFVFDAGDADSKTT